MIAPPMSARPTPNDPAYAQWLTALKTRFRQVQLKAAVAVNTELLQFYWALGADIAARQAEAQWGSGFLAQLSQDLVREFPEVKGFSRRNLEHIRRWYVYWSVDAAIAKQAASQLFAIPWWHHVVIVGKCPDPAQALFYVQQTRQHGWSRAVLTEALRDELPSIERLEAELDGP